MRYLTLAAALLATAAPAIAQQRADITQRVDKMERELRAVQRKVFPGGAEQYFEPEITAAPTAQPGVPASTPLADLTERVSGLEQEVQRLTGQVEQNSFRLRQLEDQMKALTTTAAPAPAVSADTPAPPFVTLKPPAETPAPPPAATTARKASGDAAEDAYMAGYDLWAAKRYPEAVAALKDVVAKYPKHRRASYAQNLLGRALLDDNKPANAAEAFLENYQKMPRGERAPDSLYFLGQSMMKLKPPRTDRACQVYAELIDVYGEKIDATLKERVAKGRADAKCK